MGVGVVCVVCVVWLWMYMCRGDSLTPVVSRLPSNSGMTSFSFTVRRTNL